MQVKPRGVPIRKATRVRVDLLDVDETAGLQELLQVDGIESPLMRLTPSPRVTEHEILHPPAESRLKARPMGFTDHGMPEQRNQALVVIGRSRLERSKIVARIPAEVRNDDPVDTAGLQDPQNLRQECGDRFAVDVFQNVRVVDAIDSIVRERNPLTEVVDDYLATEFLERFPPIPFEPEPS